MKIKSLELSGLKLIELELFGDSRGFFVERFNTEKMKDLDFELKIAQINHSRSAPGVVRGIHFQHTPPQGKLVGCTQGRIFDVAVDVRTSSRTFGQWYGAELSDTNGRLLWIPPGFAHGFSVLGDTSADVMYFVDAVYNPKGEAGIRFDDAEIGIDWQVKNPVISQRDQAAQSFAQYRENPVF